MDELRRSKVPGCGRGLPILLVDHDTTSLMYLASILEQFSYQVTTTEVVSVAMSMIRERKDRFKLVMADINMDDINSLSFLRILIKKGIPFILMSSERSQNVVQKAIAYGACLHLEKPISLNDLKYLWQHVYRNDMDSMKKTLSSGKEFRAIKINETDTEFKPAVARNDHFHGTGMTTNDPKGKNKKVTEIDAGIVDLNCITRLKKTRIQHMLAIEDLKHRGSSSKAKRSYDDEEDKINDKRIKSKHDPTDSKKRETTEEGGKENKNNQSSSSKGRKSRLVWNQELHHKFKAALGALGDKNARPKAILKMMNEPNLTHRQVASHLQKYKAQVQRIYTASTSNLSSVTNASTIIYDKPGFSCMLPKNKSVLSHLGHKSSNFSIGDTYRFLNLPQDSTAPISSKDQNQQFPNVPQDMHQKLNVSLDSTDSISSLNQTQQLPRMLPYSHHKLNFTVGSDHFNSVNQTLQLPNVPQYVHKMLNFIPGSTSTSISLNQSQVFMSSIQTTQGIDFVAAEYTAMPDAEKSQTETIVVNPEVDTTAHTVCSAILSENQNQHSPKLVDFLKVLDEEADEYRGSGIEPHPSEVDQFCEWLKEAMLGNNEQP
ncbi:hypothetical protein CRYUN_Cryun29cG0036500 [Craigia yunnanensis]